jgi:PhnB protein
MTRRETAMASTVSYIPAGYHTATPYLITRDAAAALEFYGKAFGATELERIVDENGAIRHAEFKIGDSPFMLTEENTDFPDWQSPQSRGGTPVHIYLYVKDADAAFKQAISCGATELLPVKDQFYGDRSGGVTDPFGHIWYIATHIEDVAPEEMTRRAAQPH